MKTTSLLNSPGDKSLHPSPEITAHTTARINLFSCTCNVISLVSSLLYDLLTKPTLYVVFSGDFITAFGKMTWDSSCTAHTPKESSIGALFMRHLAGSPSALSGSKLSYHSLFMVPAAGTDVKH